MTPEYRATAAYDGRWWTVTFDNLPPGHGGATQGRAWEEAEANARKGLASLLGVGEFDFNLVVRPDDAESRALIEALEQADAAQNAAQQAKIVALDAAARGLSAKYTYRDAGAMLGLSHQYIAKLAPKK